jgi:hypothetical protein
VEALRREKSGVEGATMKSRVMLLTIAAVTVFTTLPARADYVDGDVLVEWAKEYRRAQAGTASPLGHIYVRRFQVYVMGVHDAHDSLLVASGAAPIFCTPSYLTVAQLSNTVARFLENNRERKHEPGSILVAAALAEAFPCNVNTER